MYFVPRALLNHFKKLKQAQKDEAAAAAAEAGDSPNSYDSESSESEDEEEKAKGSIEQSTEPGVIDDHYFNPKYYPDAPLYLKVYLHFALKCNQLITADWFNYCILLVIIVAGLLVGVETYSEMQNNPGVLFLDTLILAVFVFEMGIKIFAEGLLPYRYFTNAEWKWNWFDCTIIVLSLPFWGSLFGGGSIKMLRLIRLTRLGKIVRRIPPLQMIIRGILGGLKSCGYITLLQILVFYIFSVIGYYFFSVNDPFHFGNVPFAMFTLFRLYTLDNWGDFMFINTYGCNLYQDMYVSDEDRTPFNYLLWCKTPQQYWYAPFFCLVFILVAQMIILSLFIGAVSNSMMDSMDKLQSQRQEEIKQQLIEKNKARILAFARPPSPDGRDGSITPVNSHGRESGSNDGMKNRRTGFNQQDMSTPGSSMKSSEHPSKRLIKYGQDAAYFLTLPFYFTYEMIKYVGVRFQAIENAHYQSELSKLLYIAMKYDAHEEQRVLQKKKRAATVMSSRSPRVDPNVPASPVSVPVTPNNANSSAVSSITGFSSAPGSVDVSGVMSTGSGHSQSHGHSIPTVRNGNKYANKEITFNTLLQDRPTTLIETWSIFAKFCRVIAESKEFNNFVTFIILCAAIDIGFQTDFRVQKVESVMAIVHYVDIVILSVFTIELILKLVAEEFRPWAYFYSGWNVFDFIIVLSSYVSGAGPLLLLLRLLRLLRVLKLVKKLPRLSIIINAFLIAGQSIGWALVLLLLFHYVFGIIGLMLFKSNDPHRFGSLHQSMLAVFRLISLDDSSYMAYNNAWGCDLYPDIPYEINPSWCHSPQGVGIIAFVYYIILVTIGNQILLSLFIGVLSTSLDQARTNFLKEKEFDEKISEFCGTLYAMSPKRIKAFKLAFQLLDVEGSEILDDEKIHLGLSVIEGLEILLSEEHAAGFPPGVKFKARVPIRMSEEELNFLQRKCEGSLGSAVRTVNGLHIIAFIKFLCSTPMFMNNEKVNREVEVVKKRIAKQKTASLFSAGLKKSSTKSGDSGGSGEMSQEDAASVIQRHYRQHLSKLRGGDMNGVDLDGKVMGSTDIEGGVELTAISDHQQKSATREEESANISFTNPHSTSGGNGSMTLVKHVAKLISIPDFIFAHDNDNYVY